MIAAYRPLDLDQHDALGIVKLENLTMLISRRNTPKHSQRLFEAAQQDLFQHVMTEIIHNRVRKSMRARSQSGFRAWSERIG